MPADPTVMSIKEFSQVNYHKELKLSENQILEGKVKDAQASLNAMGEKYGLQINDN